MSFQIAPIPSLDLIKVAIHHDYGKYGFAEVEPLLNEIQNIISEMASISLENPTIPIGLIWALNGVIYNFNDLINELSYYTLEGDNSTYSNRSSLVEKVQKYYESLFSNRKSDSNSSSDFLSIYTAFKQYMLSKLLMSFDINTSKEELEKQLKDVKELKDTTKNLYQTLEKQASIKSTENYAGIFENAALQYSNNRWLKWGSAQYWMLASIFAIISFSLLIWKIDFVLPIHSEKENTLIIIHYITRVLIISFCIYLITFMLKQYSIHKHLYTLNQHRKNTLDSYKLFFESMGSADIDVKNTLMMEVAKAIYDSGQTGYIGTKETDNSPSIVELTKYLKA